MDVSKYLERIGFSKDCRIDLSYDFLRELQLHHIYSVPYENVDVIDGMPLKLDLDSLYNKVVIDRRGGWCFELNCLFSHLLSELGFSCTSYFARFWRGESDVPYRRHRVIAVFIDGNTYIVDVGIGAVAPRIPLLLEEGIVQEYLGESYRFERDAEFGWVLYELRHEQWQKYFSFTEEMQIDSDFHAISFFCEYNPESKFNKSYIVALKTEKGRKSVDGNVFKEFVGRDLVRIEENMSEERINEILVKEFGLIRK